MVAMTPRMSGRRGSSTGPFPAPATVVRVPKAERLAGALWGLHVADALAMPAHWFYGGSLMVSTYYDGPIKGYVKPLEKLQDSIMNKSDTGGGGRGSAKGSIIGDVINHGKKKYWAPDKGYHYHCTLQAGENTLEVQLTRLVYNMLAANKGEFSAEELLTDYQEFMTTPGTHNDCYASTCHRMFFKNRQEGRPLDKCPDNDGHNVDTLDGIAMTIPLALAMAAKGCDDASAVIHRCVEVTRRSEECNWYASLFGKMLGKVVMGVPLAKVLQDAAALVLSHLTKADALWVKQMDWLKLDESSLRNRDANNACYLPSGFPAMLFMAYKHGGDVKSALLANANTGGENVHRGMLIGALVGAAHGVSAIPEKLRRGLVDSEAVARDIDAFARAMTGGPAAVKRPIALRAVHEDLGKDVVLGKSTRTSSQTRTKQPVRKPKAEPKVRKHECAQPNLVLPCDDNVPCGPPLSTIVPLLHKREP